MAGRWISRELERTIYVIAGLPIALRGAANAPSPEAAVIRRAFSFQYWRPRSFRETFELALGLLAAPFAVPVAALWFTFFNGRIVRQREGKGLLAQFMEQLRLYPRAGIVGPWYYILSLHRDGASRSTTFLQRCETKRGIYALLKDDNPSVIGDKRAFAQGCMLAGLRCATFELVIDGQSCSADTFPDADLFIKPLKGCGGKGAERWDRMSREIWSSEGLVLGKSELLQRLRSRQEPLLVQRLVRPHPALAALTSGALPTVRALTILDERGVPELVAAVFRMSIGSNRTVDNIHAGGLACSVSLEEGRLGIASDLGLDARLGWHERHPTTRAKIMGAQLPHWDAVKALAIEAHRSFGGRTIIGWDIAIDEEGPLIIEGNRGPDMDLMQRFMDEGFCKNHRFGKLIAHHLEARGYGMEHPLSVRGGGPARAMPGAGVDRGGP